MPPTLAATLRSTGVAGVKHQLVGNGVQGVNSHSITAGWGGGLLVWLATEYGS